MLEQVVKKCCAVSIFGNNLNPNWSQPWATCCHWHGFEQGNWQKSLLASAVLWFLWKELRATTINVVAEMKQNTGVERQNIFVCLFWNPGFFVCFYLLSCDSLRGEITLCRGIVLLGFFAFCYWYRVCVWLCLLCPLPTLMAAVARILLTSLLSGRLSSKRGFEVKEMFSSHIWKRVFSTSQANFFSF